MLTLSRKAGQSVFIGEAIEVRVRRIAGSRVTLDIEAPRDVPVLRDELVDTRLVDDPPARHPCGLSAGVVARVDYE